MIAMRAVWVPLLPHVRKMQHTAIRPGDGDGDNAGAKGIALDEAAFAALDRVCEAADATAPAAFRRLRRI